MEKEKLKELSQEELKDVSGGLGFENASMDAMARPDKLGGVAVAGGKLAGPLGQDLQSQLLENDSLIKDLGQNALLEEEKDDRINPR